MLLAIETSTNICSVSYQNKEGDIFEERHEGKSVHSEKLFLSIQALMQDHSFVLPELEAVLVSSGPGSYTGLRIAASGIKGLLFEEPCPLYSVPTLSSFAISAVEQYPSSSRIHAILDARRNHLYHQFFEVTDGKLVQGTAVNVSELDEINAMLEQGDVLIGTGDTRLSQEIVAACIVADSSLITASSLISLYRNYRGEDWLKRVSVEEFEPNYFTSNQVNNSETKSS